MRRVRHLHGAALQLTPLAAVDRLMSLLVAMPPTGRELFATEANKNTTEIRAHHAGVCDGSSLTKRQMRQGSLMPADDRFAIHRLSDQCISNEVAVDTASDFIRALFALGTQLDAIIPFVNFESSVLSLSTTRAREAMNSISCV